MNRREASLSTNLILVQNLFCRGAIGVQNLFCGRIDFRSKFILRFDFLNLTVLYSIGKRYSLKVNHEMQSRSNLE